MDEISPELLREWAEFYAEEPWGYPVEDARAARLAWLISRVFGGGDLVTTPQDFSGVRPFPDLDDEEPEDDDDTGVTMLERAFGRPPNRPERPVKKEVDEGVAMLQKAFGG